MVFPGKEYTTEHLLDGWRFCTTKMRKSAHITTEDGDQGRSNTLLITMTDDIFHLYHKYRTYPYLQ